MYNQYKNLLIYFIFFGIVLEIHHALYTYNTSQFAPNFSLQIFDQYLDFIKNKLKN